MNGIKRYLCCWKRYDILSACKQSNHMRTWMAFRSKVARRWEEKAPGGSFKGTAKVHRRSSFQREVPVKMIEWRLKPTWPLRLHVSCLTRRKSAIRLSNWLFILIKTHRMLTRRSHAVKPLMVSVLLCDIRERSTLAYCSVARRKIISSNILITDEVFSFSRERQLAMVRTEWTAHVA